MASPSPPLTTRFGLRRPLRGILPEKEQCGTSWGQWPLQRPSSEACRVGDPAVTQHIVAKPTRRALPLRRRFALRLTAALADYYNLGTLLGSTASHGLRNGLTGCGRTLSTIPLVLSQPLIRRIQAMEFRPGILGVKPPIDGGSGGITLPLQGLDFPAEGGLVGDTPP